MKVLPEDNIVGRSRIDRALLVSADWQAAKEGFDTAAAGRIVDALWSGRKTQQLKALLPTPETTLLLTQPSTSKTNVIPVCFAERLAREIGAPYLVGDAYFKSLHGRQAKHMSRSERIFNRRRYAPFDANEFKERIGARQIVIVEDILTTGGSVAEFASCLDGLGLKIKSVAGLMGDRRLNVDEKTRQRLQQALAAKQLPAGDLASILTRTEAGALIMIANNVRTEHAREKLARNIQGLLDRGTAKDLGRDPQPGRHPGAGGDDRGPERTAQRVRPGAVRGAENRPEVTGFYEITAVYKEGERMREVVTEVCVCPGLDREQLKAVLRQEAYRFVRDHPGIAYPENARVLIRPVVKQVAFAKPIEKGRGL